MFKGCAPVVTRACALNLGMLAGHDATLDWLKTVSSSPMVQTIGAKSRQRLLRLRLLAPLRLRQDAHSEAEARRQRCAAVPQQSALCAARAGGGGAAGVLSWVLDVLLPYCTARYDHTVHTRRTQHRSQELQGQAVLSE